MTGISARFSFFFCYGANHLMNGPEGNSEFCFLPHWLPQGQRKVVDLEGGRYG